LNSAICTGEEDLRGKALVVVAGVIMVLAGCASSTHRAPVEERAGGTRVNGPSAAASAAEVKVLPGAENAGKPGYYSVKPGDTLIRIGLDTGQNWRDIARWNNLDNPNVIEQGQVLRVAPPGTDASVAAARSVAPSRVESRPLDAAGKPAAGASSPVATAAASAPLASAPPASTVTPVSLAPAAAPRDAGEDELTWIWPANGPVATPFDDARTKGLAITGRAGDPVLAAADGRVVYAGSGLRGYGNLVIVKHNNTYLTAYAHNQTLLVKEEQVVRRGQKIAEMGSSDADRVELHFEIRKQGKPIDPAKLLPPR
jgi:lipoprotein NlpD